MHPFDDIEIIVGQTTLAVEIVKQLGRKGVVPDIVIAGIGGGGCTSGISTGLKMMNPNTKIIGVEPENADKLNMSFKLGRHFTFKKIDTFADGTALRSVGKIN